jgi:hypothetical protein
MARLKVNIRGENEATLDIDIPSAKETFWHSYLIRDAVVNLIETGDTAKWYDSEDELPPHEFRAAIIKAVIEQYAIDLPVLPEPPTYKAILNWLLTDLDDLLDVEIPDDDDEDDEDEE